MKEILDFIRESIHSTIDRLKFPFFNSLIVSWLIFNWKPVFIVLFEDWPMHVRVSYVSEHFYDRSSLFVAPIVAATAYLILKPLLKWAFFAILSKVNDINRRNDFTYHVAFSKERDQLAQLEYQQSVIKAGNIQASQMAQEIETLKSQIEKVENDKRLADKTIQAQVKEIQNLREISTERDKAIDSIKEFEANEKALLDKIMDLDREIRGLEKLSKENKDLHARIDTLSRGLDFEKRKLSNFIEGVDGMVGFLKIIGSDTTKDLRQFIREIPRSMVNDFENAIRQSEHRITELEKGYEDLKERALMF